jgi:hypothetical protein
VGDELDIVSVKAVTQETIDGLGAGYKPAEVLMAMERLGCVRRKGRAYILQGVEV